MALPLIGTIIIIIYQERECVEMSRNSDSRKKRKNHKRQILIFLLIFTILVWMVLLTSVVIADLQNADGKTAGDVLKTIVRNVADNMLGILPPILLFDFTLEFLTQDDSAEEVSEQITSALMGQSDTLDLFTEKARNEFLNATISSLCNRDEDRTNAAIAALKPYLSTGGSIRENFRYRLRLYRNHPVHDFENYFNDRDYWCLSETLEYTHKYIALREPTDSFKIGFFVNGASLDEHLCNEDFLFREALLVLPEDLKALCALPEQQQLHFVTKEMGLSAEIFDSPCKIKNVEISTYGIVVDFLSPIPFLHEPFKFEVSFFIPQLSSVLPPIYITSATHDVRIELIYPPEHCDISIIPFFDCADGHLVARADRQDGSCNVELNGWVSPMSGVAFNVLPRPDKVQQSMNLRQPMGG